LISVRQLTGAGGLKQLRAQLGNDIAITAFRDGKLPFPDGAIIAALHWNEVSSDADNKVLANGFPGAGLESSFAGTAMNVQFMVKDSKKYAASGGWGYADFTKRQTRQRGAARKVLSVPPACKRSRLRFHSLRTYPLN
jgi:Cytochrome P460